MNKPFYQIIFELGYPIIIGLLALGTFLGAINDAIAIITPQATYWGTIIFLLFWAASEYAIKKRYITWIAKNGQITRPKFLSSRVRLSLAGCIILLWIPRLFIAGSNETTKLVPIAENGEISILIADFRAQSNVQIDFAGRIKNAIDTSISEYKLNKVTTHRLNETFRQDELTLAIEAGEKARATIIIWGYYDDFGVFPRFTVLDPNQLDLLPESPQESSASLLTPPSDLSLYINRELPNEMVYFTQFTIGQIYYLRGDYENSLKLFASAIESEEKLENKDIQESIKYMLFYAGVASQEKASYSEAIEYYSRFLTIENKNYAVLNNRAMAYARTGNLDSAISDINLAIEITKNEDAATINARGAIYTDFVKDFDRAIQDYDKAIAIDKSFVGAYYNKGNALYAKGNLEEAIKAYTDAINLRPSYYEAYVNRGAAYSDFEQEDLALKDFDSAEQIFNNEPVLYINRGNIFARNGDFESAIAQYNIAEKVQPMFHGTYINRGQAYSDTNQHELAVQDYTKAIDLFNDFALVYCMRADEYVLLNQNQNAIQDYEICRQKTDDDFIRMSAEEALKRLQSSP